MKISKVRNMIYDITYDVKKNINNLNQKDSHFWAKISSKRYVLTAKKIVEYSKNKTDVKILNASGFGNGGDFDLSIVKYLRSINLDFEWDVYDSPENDYLEIPLLKSYIKDMKINLMYFDYTKMVNKDNKKYDIILFTEIAEHLDHSSLLNALNYLNKKLERNGKLIITTPNALSLYNRIKIICGGEGMVYYGEGNKNLDKGVYGHIVYYSPKRLKRLIEDCGYETKEIFTFNWLNFNSFIGNIFQKLIDIVTFPMRNSKDTIFLSAVRNKKNKYKIPFEV